MVTTLVSTFVDRLDAQVAGRSGGTGAAAATGGGSALPWLLGLGALGAGAWALTRSRGDKREQATAMQDARADVESLYARLGSDVQLLPP